VDAWIASGKSLSVPSEIRKTPLQVAIDIGFHSLIRLLARHQKDVANLNQALSDAVALKNLDDVNLLLEHGAEPRSIPLADVLSSWDPKVIQLFLDREADVLAGLPFTVLERDCDLIMAIKRFHSILRRSTDSLSFHVLRPSRQPQKAGSSFLSKCSHSCLVGGWKCRLVGSTLP
jgi:hypothetical protein